jgi:signal peptidase I
MTEADEPDAGSTPSERPEASSSSDTTASAEESSQVSHAEQSPSAEEPTELAAPPVAHQDDVQSETGESSAESAADLSASSASSSDVNGDGDGDGEAESGEDAGRGKHRGKKPKRKAPWWELPALVVGAIVLAILLKSFVLQPFYIPSESMEKTLHGCTGCAGDRILVNKVIYDFRDPHPGDIVVFHAPPGWDDGTGTAAPTNPFVRVVRGFGQLIGFVPPDGEVLVKRVIATGGQTVRGVDVNGKNEVQISNTGATGPWRTLKEPYVFEDGADGYGVFGPVTVPKGRLWVMGDHRNDSLDSRWHCGPDATNGDTSNCDPMTSTVPNGNVIGKAFVIAWPPSRWRTLGTPVTFKNGG